MSKMVVFLTFVLCLSACATRQSAGSSAERSSLANQYASCWRHFNERRWNELSSCYVPEATGSILGLNEDIRGRDAVIAAGARAFARAFSDATGEPQLTLIAGGEVVSVVLLRGTHDGPLAGPMGDVPPTGKRVGLFLTHGVHTNRQGKATHEVLAYDLPWLLAQLGMNPGPARPAQESPFTEHGTITARGDAAEAGNVATHRRIYELFGRADRTMFEHMADSIVESNFSEPEDVIGKSGLVAFNEAFWTGFPDIHVDVERTFGARDYTVLAGRLRGTNTGPMPALGIDKTGKAIDVAFIEIVRWRGGKAERSWPFMNSLALAAQLGLMDGR